MGIRSCGASLKSLAFYKREMIGLCNIRSAQSQSSPILLGILGCPINALLARSIQILPFEVCKFVAVSVPNLAILTY